MVVKGLSVEVLFSGETLARREEKSRVTFHLLTVDLFLQCSYVHCYIFRKTECMMGLPAGVNEDGGFLHL